ncbi:hypothetical protein IFM12275_24330 [Nocardia sputorum]|nr:hypothetical protein IFM12275_24330 [Nocardia sputorum]
MVNELVNDEAELAAVITTVPALAQQIVWTVDIIAAPAALLLARAGQPVRYAPGPDGCGDECRIRR